MSAYSDHRAYFDDGADSRTMFETIFHILDPDPEDDDERLEHIRNAIHGLPDDHDHKPVRHIIVDSLWFHIVVNILTLCNTVQMGLEVDNPQWDFAWLVCENVFTAGFAIEMVIKLAVLRWSYFHDKANNLDGFLACLGILDCWILKLIGGGADLQSFSVLRILRLMRLGRVFKLVRNFKPFVLVIQGVIQAISTTCNVFALLVIILYVFAIFLTEQLGHNVGDLYPGYSEEESVIDTQEIMVNYNPHLCFGSMLASMLTLFNMAMMAEWAEIVRPVSLKQPFYIIAFVVFALLVAFSVMNVMIGSIVDSVFSESKRIDLAFKTKIKAQKLHTLEKVQALLEDMDINRDGVVDLEELREAYKANTELKKLLKDINLPCGWSPDELLDMLDNSGDGLLQKKEFITSFFRLMESDSFQQICIIQASINQVKHTVLKQSDKVFKQCQLLGEELTRIRIKVKETDELLIARGVTEEDSFRQIPAGRFVNCASEDATSFETKVLSKLDRLASYENLALSRQCTVFNTKDQSLTQSFDQMEEDETPSPTVECTPNDTVAALLDDKLPVSSDHCITVCKSHCQGQCEGGAKEIKTESGSLERCPDDICNESMAAVTHSSQKKLTEILDAACALMKEFLQKELAHVESRSLQMGNLSDIMVSECTSTLDNSSCMAADSKSSSCADRAGGPAEHVGVPTSPFLGKQITFEEDPPSPLKADHQVPAIHAGSTGNNVAAAVSAGQEGDCEGFDTPRDFNVEMHQEHPHEGSPPSRSPFFQDAVSEHPREGPTTHTTCTATCLQHGLSDLEHSGFAEPAAIFDVRSDSYFQVPDPPDTHVGHPTLATSSGVIQGPDADVPLHDRAVSTSANQADDSTDRPANNVVHPPLASAEMAGNIIDPPANPDVHGPQHLIDFTFDDSVLQLGFEVCWVSDRLPVVLRVSPDGAAHSHGVLSGDRLLTCNGVSTVGEQRDASRQLLRERPLLIRMLRTNESSNGIFPAHQDHGAS